MHTFKSTVPGISISVFVDETLNSKASTFTEEKHTSSVVSRKSSALTITDMPVHTLQLSAQVFFVMHMTANHHQPAVAVNTKSSKVSVPLASLAGGRPQLVDVTSAITLASTAGKARLSEMSPDSCTLAFSSSRRFIPPRISKSDTSTLKI